MGVGWIHLIGLTLTFLISDPSRPEASEGGNLCGRVAISFFSVKTVHETVRHLTFAFCVCVCTGIGPAHAGDRGGVFGCFSLFCSDI